MAQGALPTKNELKENVLLRAEYEYADHLYFDHGSMAGEWCDACMCICGAPLARRDAMPDADGLLDDGAPCVLDVDEDLPDLEADDSDVADPSCLDCLADA